MRAICAVIREQPDYLRREYLRFAEMFKERGLKNIHSDYVAAVALGDYLAETIIFDTDKETAEHEAVNCGAAVYAMNAEQLSDNAVARAWDFTQGWLVSNEGRFSMDASPYYGKIEQSNNGQETEFFVIPQYLDDALEDAGFNVKKTMQGFKEQGYLKVFKDSEGKFRTKTRVRISSNLLSVYRFNLQRDGIRPLGSKNVNNSHAD
jgi:hypothetical protein